MPNLNLAGCTISVWALSKVIGRLSIGLFWPLSKIMQELRHLLVRCIKMDGGSSKMMLLRRIGFIMPEPCTIPKPALCGFFYAYV